MTTNKELSAINDQEYKLSTARPIVDHIQHDAGKIMSLQQKQERDIKDLIQDWKSGSHGWMPEEKLDKMVNLIYSLTQSPTQGKHGAGNDHRSTIDGADSGTGKCTQKINNQRQHRKDQVFCLFSWAEECLL